jgi:hypothetical protein
MTRGQPPTNTSRGIHSENLYTPLYTESQETDHTYINTDQQPLVPMNTSDADIAAAAAAEAEAGKLETAANAAGQSTEDQKAEAAAAAAATFIARMAAETEAAAIAEAEKAQAEAEAAAKAAADDATLRMVEERALTGTAEIARMATEAANAMAREQEAAAAAETERHRQEALAAATAAAMAGATAAKKAAAAAVAKEIARKGKAAQQAKAPGGSAGGNLTIAQPAMNASLPEDYEEWEISEGDLPEGSNLLGNKALLEDYPEDEANSRKNKKNNPGKGKKGQPKNKA